MNGQYMATMNAVEVKETVLEELNKQTEETIQTVVETEANPFDYIHDGDWIRVDGTNGTVEILKRAEK